MTGYHDETEWWVVHTHDEIDSLQVLRDGVPDETVVADSDGYTGISTFRHWRANSTIAVLHNDRGDETVAIGVRPA